MTETEQVQGAAEDILVALAEAGDRGLTVADLVKQVFWGETAIRAALTKLMQTPGTNVDHTKGRPARFFLNSRPETRKDQLQRAKEAAAADEDNPFKLAYEDGRRDALAEIEARQAEAERLGKVAEKIGPTSLPYGSRLIAALEAVWAEIQAKHGEDVPDVVMVTGSGVQKRNLRLGHHAHGRWHAVTDDPDEEGLTEIFLSGERLGDGPRGVLSTLLHEAAHAINRSHGRKDTSNGRYHNKTFVATAETLGLITATEAHPSLGWSFTECPQSTYETYESVKVLEEWYLSIGQGTGYGAVAGLPTKITAPAPVDGPKMSGKLLRATCKCEKPRILRVSKTTLAAGGIRCDVCGELFEADEADLAAGA